MAAGLCACAWIVGGGVAGPLYVLIYVLAAVPGLPLGFMLFGGRHPGGWIAGALLGYATTALVIWVPIAARAPSVGTFLRVWAVLAAATWFTWRRVRGPSIVLPAWTGATSAGLAIVLLLTLALSAPPLARVGTRDAGGNRYYRAYFIADFVWHTALTAELAKFSMPPRNPYLAPQPIHYYWTYFLLPAAVSETGPAPLRDVQACLKVNALLTGLLFMSAVFLATWVTVGAAAPVTIAVSLALLAASAEGTYEIYRLWSRGEALSALRDINIDAVTAWQFQGHRIDGLPRCLWYVPQHSMAYALGLVAITGVAAIGSAGSAVAILLSGIALASSAAINPFVGGVFALAWGAAVAIDAATTSGSMQRILRHALAAAPVAVTLAWCGAVRMVDGAGGTLDFGLAGASLHAPVLTLLLSLGPVLIPTLFGVVARSPVPFRRVRPAIVLVVVSLLLMYLVRLRVDQAWVPFRAGQLFLVAAPALMARGLAALWNVPRARGFAIGVAAVLLAAGLPTTAIDAYNAQDIGNRGIGSGFHWTLVLGPDEQEALAWIQRMTPATAIVQMEPTVRDRELSPGAWGERWSVVPAFAQRRMAAGLPISLIRIPAYAEKSSLVRTLYQTSDAREAWTIARKLRIDFLYVDAIDRQAYGGGAKFDTSPEFFSPVFTRGLVGVYQVR